MKTQIIKVDSAFPDSMRKINELLNDGWKIIDKTVTGDRYIIYIFAEKSACPDCGFNEKHII